MAKKFFLVIVCVLQIAIISRASPSQQSHKNMALFLTGSSPILGYGASISFEYAFSKYLGMLVPIDYQFVARSMFAESSKFDIITGNLALKFYFSQLFWPQKALRGFFIQAKVGSGYAHQTGGYPHNFNNKSATLTLAAALGYSHALDCGLVLGGNVEISGRAFFKPIDEKTLLDTLPSLGFSIGWAF